MNPEQLEPKNLWKNFFALCAIPHPSHHEAALSSWLHQQAKALGLDSRQDIVGNVIVRKPASPGFANRPGIILQAHMDMVPQARSDSGHNFAKDPIQPRLHPDKPEWLMASGTTLGADDGIGVAAMLCFMEDNTLEHGPLEFLFTVNEEDGMTGAMAISSTALHGKYLLNLDWEDMDEFSIGCGGTIRTQAILHLHSLPVEEGWQWFTVRVEGLVGGHSGIDINRGRGHAGNLLCRLLEVAPGDYTIGDMASGDAASAIPREAEARVGVPPFETAAWQQALRLEAQYIAGELDDSDPGFNLVIQPTDAPAQAIDAEESRMFVNLIQSLPNGLLAMETDIANAVRTSSNLGILKLSNEGPGAIFLETLCMVRSSSDIEKEGVANEIDDILFKAGATTKRTVNSPAWTPEPRSALLATASHCYQNIFGKLPVITATHAALECSLFRPVYPHWEMLSIGPTIRNPHSPDEMVSVESVAQFWHFLVALVKEIR
ncbi:MAG: hypothetical protein A2087_04795 [Spirochaetes bacterium GWD1_61_31]|nr:MAG: hypothetical protein A2Y37_01665 [Spirochaetes bacterium GWB1_60_80]OHD34921.1 MAG: hypothetical protein A2004_00695 [Spirochaetes bacterium GWC1_61_12]OHD37050.1 MAG: hypothetical protein A2087_04795 [Spirochaetes bacterium GWD1_61_31]OHD45340.1 MAG: hypothetical protein A2Y35_00595 [Spirochaetes bacterium GWE1_60_18]OHD61092.1 MAG: hypothetical protein A2Y32_09280 [Spirochaetes bacterium GWF1_60_12]HAP42754.1 cytosol nonspecific dipeptidase [Spirochaetaceae bacterium]